MKKVKLLPPQLKTVSAWMHKKQGAEIRQIIDRSCRYRDAFILWQDKIQQPDGSLDIIFFRTRLELTPSGKIRVEESRKQGSKTLTNNHQNLLPLEGVNFVAITPKKIERNYLYPNDTTKPKQKKTKPQQLKLPISKTEITLLEAAIAKGDRRIQSVQELYVGNGQIQSLDFGIVRLPQALINIAQSFNPSITEWEAIAQMAIVLNPNQMLNFIESIPDMRKIPQFSKFQEPVTVKTNLKTKQNQTQGVKS